jgi:thiol:disulfide interchange protein DsbD
MGLILLAGATFFATTVLVERVGTLLWTAWLGTLAFWLIRALVVGPGLGARLVPALVLVIGLSGAVALGFDGNSHGQNTLPWQPLTEHALADARAVGAPVLVEFTADWCINCKVLEQTVYADATIAQAVDAAQMRVLRADLTRPDATLDAYLRSFGGAGLPFAVVLKPDGTVHRRLPDLFTVGTLKTAIETSGEQTRVDP